MKKIFQLFLIVLFPVLIYSQDITTAQKYLDEKNYTEAKSVLEKILDKNEKNHEAHYLLGKALIGLKIYDDASDEFEEAVELNDTSSDYHYWLGAAYGQDAMNSSVFTQVFLAPKIKKQFLRAVELDSNNTKARSALISYYMQAPGIMGGSMEKAFEQANILVKQDEKNGRLTLARLFEKEEKYAQAVNEYKVLENKYGTDKDFTNFYNVYGYFLLRIGKGNEAVDKFKKQVELSPNDANSYDSLGDGYLAIDKKDDAKAQFKKALSIDPNFEASKKKLEKLTKQ